MNPFPHYTHAVFSAFRLVDAHSASWPRLKLPCSRSSAMSPRPLGSATSRREPRTSCSKLSPPACKSPWSSASFWIADPSVCEVRAPQVARLLPSAGFRISASSEPAGPVCAPAGAFKAEGGSIFENVFGACGRRWIESEGGWHRKGLSLRRVLRLPLRPRRFLGVRRLHAPMPKKILFVHRQAFSGQRVGAAVPKLPPIDSQLQ